MGRRVPRRVAEVLLIVLMGVGSIFLWVGIPAGWLYVASRLSDKYPKIYLLALIFCPLTMILFGWVLVRLNGLYIGLFPEPEQRRPRGREAWMRSVGADASTRQPQPVLETFMSISVALAVVALIVWFIFFAGSSLPPP
jgi:uncharacterized membrane protein YidH (DUF202 family)